MPTLTIPEFVTKWQRANLNERSAAQSHFNDLCHALGVPTPSEADPDGTFYRFEQRLTKEGGGIGFADVWYRDHFAWEYKSPDKHLDEPKHAAAAFSQLLQYAPALYNPPLLVVSDLKHFIVSTRFTGYPTETSFIKLEDLLTNQPTDKCPKPPIEVLRALFQNREYLRPELTIEKVTEKVAARFGDLARMLLADKKRGYDPHLVARYLMRILFCLFAEDISLLPNQLFTTLLKRYPGNITVANRQIQQIFTLMGQPDSFFGLDAIPYFNGGLFTDEHLPIQLYPPELATLGELADLNWANIEPAIFGTLFERSIDPQKRSQLGQHYTSSTDIATIVQPVIIDHLRREWEATQQQATALITQRDSASGSRYNVYARDANNLVNSFLDRLARVRVLDPACGSGNFLYVALKLILDLEAEVRGFALRNHINLTLPGIVGFGPHQLYGIEKDDYAHELASAVVWIGYLQWLHDNGYPLPTNPVLEDISDNITLGDAILTYTADGSPQEPQWSEADYIIGNPPFLGGNRIRSELGNEYVDKLFDLYEGRVPASADFVCYWFEKARTEIEVGKATRAGLLATQGIRGGMNRRVLDRIKETGDIFWARSDQKWELNGATVHVSMVGFDNGTEQQRELDRRLVTGINANLTSNVDLTRAVQLKENANICLRPDEKGGAFQIDDDTAQRMLRAPLNVNSRPNSDVIRRWMNAQGLIQRPTKMWIIDFGVHMREEDAAAYQLPYAYVVEKVKPERASNNVARLRDEWWIHRIPAADMRHAIARLKRYIATPRVSKHRIFAWLDTDILPDCSMYVFARDDDYLFGTLQSKVHELWSRATGTQLRDAESGFRYTPTSTFETFPFPYPPGNEPLDSTKVAAIAIAARKLVTRRDRSLKPVGEDAAELKKRTLTSLYNERPTWLRQLHQELDHAVLDAYGWDDSISNEEILARLLALNLERSKGNALQPDQAEAANPITEDIPPDEWISDLPSIASDDVQAGITAIVRSYPEYMVQKVSRQGQPLSLALLSLLNLPHAVANRMWQRQLHSWLQGIRFISWLQEKSYTQKQILAMVEEDGTELSGLAAHFCNEAGYDNAEAFARKVGRWLKHSGSAALTNWLTGANWYSRLDQYLNTRYHGVFLMDKSAQLAELYRVHGETIRSIASDTFVLYDGEGALEHGTNGYDVRKQLRELQIPANELPALLIWPQLLSTGIFIRIAPLLDAAKHIPTASNQAAEEDRYALVIKLLKELITLMESGSDLPNLYANIERWVAAQVPAGGIIVTLYTALNGGVSSLSSPDGVQVNIGVTQSGDSFVGNRNVSTGGGDIKGSEH